MPELVYSRCKECNKPIKGNDFVIEVVSCMPTTNDKRGHFKQRKKSILYKYHDYCYKIN